MKKRTGILLATAALGCALAFSGCSGCNNSAVAVTPLASNWYANTTFKGIQPTFKEGNTDKEGNTVFSKETVSYSVNFDNKNAGNKVYSVEYAEGTYTTEFYAKAFDREAYTLEEYKNSYPEKAVTAYYFKTVLDMPEVTYKFKDKKAAFKDDKVVTESYFLSVDGKLRPLYSKHEIKSTTPANYQPTTLEECYKKVECTYTTYYNYNGSQAKTVITENGKDSKGEAVDLTQAKNMLFDSSYLPVVARAMKLQNSFTQAVSLYTPAGGVADFNLSGAGAKTTAAEKAQIEGVLKGKNLLGEKDELSTVKVSVALISDLAGTSQSYWFASIKNVKNNSARSTMVKVTVPAPFGLGTFNYVLNGIDATLWNGV